VKFASFREPIDTDGPLGRPIVVIIGPIAELERNLIVERVRAGMRRPAWASPRSNSTAKPSATSAGAASA
jgi:Resolvase, N terminal domain